MPNYLRYYRDQLGWSRSKLSYLTQVPENTIRKLELDFGASDGRKFTRQWAEKFAAAMGIPPEKLMFGPKTVPLVGKITPGGFQPTVSAFEVESALDVIEGIVAAEAEGAAIVGVPAGEWMVFFEKQARTPDELVAGRMALVDAGGRFLLRIPVRSGGKWDLHAPNQVPILGADIREFHRVVAIHPRQDAAA